VTKHSKEERTFGSVHQRGQSNVNLRYVQILTFCWLRTAAHTGKRDSAGALEGGHLHALAGQVDVAGPKAQRRTANLACDGGLIGGLGRGSCQASARVLEFGQPSGHSAWRADVIAHDRALSRDSMPRVLFSIGFWAHSRSMNGGALLAWVTATWSRGAQW